MRVLRYITTNQIFKDFLTTLIPLQTHSTSQQTLQTFISFWSSF